MQLVTATLAVTSSFERELDRCCTCNDLKQVISAKSILRSPAGLRPAPAHPQDQNVMGS